MSRVDPVGGPHPRWSRYNPVQTVADFYNEETDKLRGQREPRAYAILDAWEAYQLGELSAEELKVAARVARLHAERLGGMHDGGPVSQLAKLDMVISRG